jgi:hypothetical protein
MQIRIMFINVQFEYFWPYVFTEKNWLAKNQNNVFEWSDISTREMLFQ